MTAADLIATTRERSGMTQRQLALRCQTSAAAICEYEAGRRVPRVDTLERIVAAAGARMAVDVHWPAPPVIDVEANGRVLEDLLDLVDHLPHRRPGPLSAPVFARHAR